MQIVKFQVGIISLDPLYCIKIYSQDEESNGSMTSEMVLTARCLTCLESAHLIHEFLKYRVHSKPGRRHCHWTIYQELCQLMIRTVQTFVFLLRRGMARRVCMLPVVFEKIANPKAKTWSRPRPMNVQDIKDKPGGKT